MFALQPLFLLFQKAVYFRDEFQKLLWVLLVSSLSAELLPPLSGFTLQEAPSSNHLLIPATTKVKVVI